MLYTLITFVGLFVAATTVAVIYYVKAEELRTTRDSLQGEIDALVSREESRNIGSIVGTKMPGRSNLGSVVQYLNELVLLVKGAPVPATSAEVKASSTARLIDPLLQRAATFITLPTAQAPVDPNTIDPDNPPDPNEVKPVRVALVNLIGELLTKLEQTTSQRDATQAQLTTLRGRFDDAIKTMQESEEGLTAKVGEYQQQVQQIKSDYDDLRTLVQQNSDERAKTLLDQLDRTRSEAADLNQNLLKTKAELTVAQGRLVGALEAVNKIKPAPDQEAAAFQPDGEVIRVDETQGLIYINLGSEDRIYRGLTFSVYDKGAGIPRDGKPKAQVEVMAIERRVASARILSSERKNPIHVGDSVANLIWNAKHQNQFVVAGEFDLDRNGETDYDGVRKIEGLIQKWGGLVAQGVSAETDFVILGMEPKVPAEPTLDEQMQDPLAMDRYNAQRKANDRYQQIRRQAESLNVPIYNYDRFLYFTGYAMQINQAGAF
jgi:hypothetical protein